MAVLPLLGRMFSLGVSGYMTYNAQNCDSVIGERINREVLENQRAEYGKQIVASVARQLREEFGSKGFDEKNIRRMM